MYNTEMPARITIRIHINIFLIILHRKINNTSVTWPSCHLTNILFTSDGSGFFFIPHVILFLELIPKDQSEFTPFFLATLLTQTRQESRNSFTKDEEIG
jgi:hypothetical protein